MSLGSTSGPKTDGEQWGPVPQGTQEGKGQGLCKAGQETTGPRTFWKQGAWPTLWREAQWDSSCRVNRMWRAFSAWAHV